MHPGSVEHEGGLDEADRDGHHRSSTSTRDATNIEKEIQNVSSGDKLSPEVYELFPSSPRVSTFHGEICLTRDERRDICETFNQGWLLLYCLVILASLISVAGDRVSTAMASLGLQVWGQVYQKSENATYQPAAALKGSLTCSVLRTTERW
jgi:hypothetical protein